MSVQVQKNKKTKASKKKDENKIKVTDLDNYQLARWYSLYYAVNLIADKAEDKNISFDDVKIDQIALDKYVDEIADDVAWKLDNTPSDETYSWRKVSSLDL